MIFFIIDHNVKVLRYVATPAFLITLSTTKMYYQLGLSFSSYYQKFIAIKTKKKNYITEKYIINI